MQYILSFIVLGIIFAIIDAIWLKSTNAFYKKELGGLLRTTPNFIAAIIFYIIYIAGVVGFVLSPALQVGEWWQAGTMGALFGLVAYATYDLTNLATLRGWPVKLVIIDIIWGMVVTAVSCMVAYFLVSSWL